MQAKKSWMLVFIVMSTILVLSDLVVPFIIKSSIAIELYFNSGISFSIALITFILPGIGILVGNILYLVKRKQAKILLFTSIIPYFVIGILVLLTNFEWTGKLFLQVPFFQMLNISSIINSTSIGLMSDNYTAILMYTIFNKAVKYLIWVYLFYVLFKNKEYLIFDKKISK